MVRPLPSLASATCVVAGLLFTAAPSSAASSLHSSQEHLEETEISSRCFPTHSWRTVWPGSASLPRTHFLLLPLPSALCLSSALWAPSSSFAKPRSGLPGAFAHAHPLPGIDLSHPLPFPRPASSCLLYLYDVPPRPVCLSCSRVSFHHLSVFFLVHAVLY